jgi:hypothetical protein
MGVRQMGKEDVPWSHPLGHDRHDLKPRGLENRLFPQGEDQSCAGEPHCELLLVCDTEHTKRNSLVRDGEMK